MAKQLFDIFVFFWLQTRECDPLQDWPELSPHIYSDEHDLVICELVDPNPAVMPKPARRNSSASASASSPPAAAPPLGDTTAAHNNNHGGSGSTAGSLAGMLEQFDAAALAAQEEAAAVLRGILAYMNTLLLSNGACCGLMCAH